MPLVMTRNRVRFTAWPANGCWLTESLKVTDKLLRQCQPWINKRGKLKCRQNIKQTSEKDGSDFNR